MEKCVECFDEMKLTNARKETFESIVGVLKREKKKEREVEIG